MSIQNSDNCGCCEGLSVETPVEVYNRPGLSAISYRVGDHTSFKESLLARLSNSGLPALRELTTRSDDDFTIALLDAWATVSDVLSFYQERIANESYLGTATEQFSILQLARLIGYELSPGVAAGTCLAFTLEDVPGQQLLSPAERNQALVPPVTIDIGTKVQSTPGPGEKAQTFETIEAIEARPEWNAIQPRLVLPQLTITESNILVLDGTANDLKAGDIILISNGLKPRKILDVYIDSSSGTTWVYLSENAALPVFNEPVYIPNGSVNDYLNKTALTSQVLNSLFVKTWREEDLSTIIATQGWSVADLADAFSKLLEAQLTKKGVVSVFRKKASVFGYNAFKEVTFTDNKQNAPSEWVLDESNDTVYLDTAYDQVTPNSYIAIQKSTDKTIEDAKPYKVKDANIRAHTKYGISGRSSALTIDSNAPWWETKTDLSAIRFITVHAQSSPLLLSATPLDNINNVVSGDVVTLTKYYPGLKTGKSVILTGERADLPGTNASEIRSLKEILVANGLTVLVFDTPLDYTYVRNKLTINANVAAATHGETVKEVLGSGNAASSFQQFVLKQPPLTYISSSSANGTKSTLEIRVNNILWEEVPSFFERGPAEHIYITRQDDQANTTVIFGDGKNGSRLPTGRENIKATYRKGIGSGGLLKANQLSQLMTRPLGVKAATNPLITSGAEDGEVLADARSNATLTIFTLGRIVSLQDYEDFARAFAGISKALATWTWTGQKRSVYLTVAGTAGATVEQDLYKKLVSAIQQAGIPGVPVTVVSYQARFFRLVANIQVDPAYLPDLVLPAVEKELRDHFSFSNRSFGQPVALSEVFSVMQNVEGVTAVDIDKLYRSDDPVTLQDRLDAEVPRPGNESADPAEILIIDSRPVDLKIML
jgi:hypothetical protein